MFESVFVGDFVLESECEGVWVFVGDEVEFSFPELGWHFLVTFGVCFYLVFKACVGGDKSGGCPEHC